MILPCVTISGCQNFWLNLLRHKGEDKVAFERNVQLASFSDFCLSLNQILLQLYLQNLCYGISFLHSLSLLMSKGHIKSSYSYFLSYHSSRWTMTSFKSFACRKVRILWKTEAKILIAFSHFADSSNSGKCYCKGGKKPPTVKCKITSFLKSTQPLLFLPPSFPTKALGGCRGILSDRSIMEKVREDYNHKAN